MIDSHCHLDHEPMYSDLKNVLNRSKDSGVEKILSICTTNDSFHKIIEIIKIDPIIYGTYGIHPHETSADVVTKEEIIKNASSNKRIIDIVNKISKIGGITLLITGVLIITNQLQSLGYYMFNIFPFLQNLG